MSDEPRTGEATIDQDLRDEARATAQAAAARAGVSLTDVHDHASARRASQLLDRAWGRSTHAGPVLATEALTAIAHAGGQVTVAERDGEVVGATAGLLGRDHDHDRVFVHSHVTGVLPDLGGHGIGRALKWHQRAWCLERGIDLVRWTFDPLVRRNAVLNLLHLGAHAVSFHRDVYGQIDDARNAGLPTDRLVVEWQLAGARCRAAATGRAAAPDLDGLARAGAQTWLQVGDDGLPELTATRAARRLVQVPADIETLRGDDPQAAARWGHALRDTLGAALEAGERISGITRDGWYVLARPAGVTELADA